MPDLTRIGLVVLIVSLLVTVPIVAAAQTGTLRVRVNVDIRSTDPGVNRDANTDMVMAHLVEGLVAFREDTSIGALLARKYDSVQIASVRKHVVGFHGWPGGEPRFWGVRAQ